MQISIADTGILSHKADMLVVGVGGGGARKPPLAAAALKDLPASFKPLLASLPKGQRKMVLPFPGSSYKCICLVDTGAKGPADALALAKRLAEAAASAASLEHSSVAVDLASVADGLEANEAVRVAAQALENSSYKFHLGLRQARNSLGRATLLVAEKSAGLARPLRVGKAIGEGMRAARQLGELPPNMLYPETLAKEVKRIGGKAKLKVKVLDKKALTKLKMNAILTVGQGSARDPRLIVLHHNGGKEGQAPIVLVGKGVTFDTGGNSLKPGSAMVDMKYDMCGAAGVFGTLLACASMRLPLNVAAVIPSVENMVAGNSYRPDDVIRMMDGQTVEVLNTDAEGRLILADALTYAQRFLRPKMMIDAATLTGACLIALGQHRCGMTSNDDTLADEISAAGEKSGDLCWRLPIDEAYNSMLKSEFADFANIGGGRMAGTITAACFLGRFVKKVPWAHLDIAGSAWQRRRASGRPVPLLATLLAKRARLIS